jgi:hypothetical protein
LSKDKIKRNGAEVKNTREKEGGLKNGIKSSL